MTKCYNLHGVSLALESLTLSKYLQKLDLLKSFTAKEIAMDSSQDRIFKRAVVQSQNLGLKNQRIQDHFSTQHSSRIVNKL